MDSRPLKILAAMTAVAALLFGYLAFVTSREEAASALALPDAALVPANWPTVVVAGIKIEQGKPIDAAALKAVSMQAAPPDAFAKVEDVAGMTPTQNISQGELVTRDHFATGNDLADKLASEERAVALPVDDVIGVGGLLQPGDYVDVIAFVQADGRQVLRSQARVVMERLRILTINGLEASSRGPVHRTAVLAVPARDVPRLVLASNAGSLRLALHGTAAVSPTRLGSAALLRELGQPIANPKTGGDQIVVYRGGSSSRVVP